MSLISQNNISKAQGIVLEDGGIFMLKKRRTKMGIALMALVILTASVTAFAKSYIHVYVYGSTYTVVADGKNDNNGANFVTVTLTEILKSDYATSDYSKVRGDVLDSSGNQISINTDVSIDLNQATNIILKQNYPSTTSMKLRMKGNKSSLDCIVTFTASIS